MRKSTIHKHTRAGARTELAAAIGSELRRRRRSAGLSQSRLGDPLTRAFVSSVENGRTVPSVPALALLVDRLGITLGEFFSGVHSDMTGAYNALHEQHDPYPPSRRRR